MGHCAYGNQFVFFNFRVSRRVDLLSVERNNGTLTRDMHFPIAGYRRTGIFRDADGAPDLPGCEELRDSRLASALKEVRIDD